MIYLSNELGEKDKIRGLPSFLSLFHNEFNKFNNSTDNRYHMALRFPWNIISFISVSLCTQRCYGRYTVSRKTVNH